jgi:hypothetical protein
MARSRLLSLVLAGASAWALVLGAAQACGPSFPQAVFTFGSHPDMPLGSFAAGKLGVVLPSYARSYLVIAYRYLTGIPLDPAEQQAVLALWSARLIPPSSDSNSPDNVALDTWRAARQAVLGASPAPDIQVDKEIPGSTYYVAYANCLPNAFRTAAQTLFQRITRFGPANPQVRDWLGAQDAVFVNCNDGAAIPTAAAQTADPLGRVDRAYQIAAAHFYAGAFDTALGEFRAIAADAASPWRTLAPYLAARTLVRKATLGAGEGEVDTKALAEADRQIGVILADPSLADVHPAALRLRGFVRFRSEPDARRSELAAELCRPKRGPELQQLLADYTLLLDKLIDDGEGEERAAPPPLPQDRAEDLTRWILLFQAGDGDAAERAVRAWRADGGLPWLVAAISKVEPAHPAVPDLLAAAANVERQSPGWATVNYQAIRLLVGRGDRDQARARLDGMLADGRSALPQGTVNLLLAQRLPLAGSLDAFARDLQRLPVATSAGEAELPDDVDGDVVTQGPKESRQPRMDENGARYVNRAIPLALRRRLVDNDGLTEPLRRELAITGWVRAIVAGDETEARAYAELAGARAPELRDALAAYLAAAPADRHFTAVYTLLRSPGLEPFTDWGVGRTTPLGEIDEFRDNWWCRIGGTGAEQRHMLALAFLSDDERRIAQQQWLALQAVPTGPNYLAAETIVWAQAHPTDPRVPEALHLAVRATRYGCTDDETSQWSNKAFQLLHRRYPKSEWAAKTKYHY